MFFYLSKVLWLLVEPGNLLLIGLVLGTILMWSSWRRTARWLITITAVYALFLAVIPIGGVISADLENRFAKPVRLPADIAGIIVLGGVVDQFISKERGQTSFNSAVERITEFVRLAHKYPRAKLIFSGGSGSLSDQSLKEAHYVGPLLKDLGLDPARVIFEDQSRNTVENARLSKKLAAPGPDDKWLVITSAFHMPRTMGTFRQAGWNVIPFPVDYHTTGRETLDPGFHLVHGLGSLGGGLHEWIGLTFYWLTGRTNEWYPGPK